MKPNKCLLLCNEVGYLAYVVSASGIKPDPAKIEKVRHYPIPTDITKVRQFLGFALYYRRFIPGFAKIAHSLHALTKKNVPFKWNSDCNTAFNLLKDCLITAPVLSYPQFGDGKEFVLETDASGIGLGAVLAQEQQDGQLHPTTYASRTLDPHERNYGITELETLALVWAVRYFRPYILGHRTIVFTDHAACTSLLNAARPSGKLARWALNLQEMDLVIKHRSGKSNTNADALSCNPVSSVGAVDALQENKDSLRTSSRRENVRNQVAQKTTLTYYLCVSIWSMTYSLLMRNWLERLLLRVNALSSSKVCFILSLLPLWVDSVWWCPGVYEKPFCRRVMPVALQGISLQRRSMTVCDATTGGKEYVQMSTTIAVSVSFVPAEKDQ